MLSDDLEYYPDPTGLSVWQSTIFAYDQTEYLWEARARAIARHAGGLSAEELWSRRIGIHRFRHPAQPEEGVGDAKFINPWQLIDGTWQVTHVISYEHNKGLLADRG